MMQGDSTRGFSFEFFPPKTELGRKRFADVVRELSVLSPSFVSVTFGAGGSSREGSYQTAAEIVRTTGLDVTPHLSCVGSTVEQIGAILETYRAIGVRRVMALRGDLPNDEPNLPRAFEYASGLVEYIRGFGGFHISVACYPEFHPEAPDPQSDIDNFVRKVQAGADEAITQYFYSNEAYYRFVDQVRARGVDVPIVPGILPITDYRQVARFSAFCGAEIPRWMRLRMESLSDDPAGQQELGIELASRQLEELLRNDVPGIHFYTLNRSEAIVQIWDNLGLSRAPKPQLHSPGYCRTT